MRLPKFSKYEYTCPDVIHARKIQKRVAYTNLGVLAVFYGFLFVWAKSDSSDYTSPFPPVDHDTPTE